MELYCSLTRKPKFLVYFVGDSYKLKATLVEFVVFLGKEKRNLSISF